MSTLREMWEQAEAKSRGEHPKFWHHTDRAKFWGDVGNRWLSSGVFFLLGGFLVVPIALFMQGWHVERQGEVLEHIWGRRRGRSEMGKTVEVDDRVGLLSTAEANEILMNAGHLVLGYLIARCKPGDEVVQMLSNALRRAGSEATYITGQQVVVNVNGFEDLGGKL